MLTVEQNEFLTRVGAGTPMGEYFRRFWLPALLDRELPGPDCDPVRTRILGEDLVAFRDSAGKVGVLDAFCPHRRAAMYYGRNEEGGLRCVYHGQKFDTDGRCLDYPAAPPGSKLKDKAFIKSYPTYETGGLIWVYLGPRELMPPRPPELPFTNMPTEDLTRVRYLLECNWMQNLEGDLDLVHIPFLHSTSADGYFTADGLGTDFHSQATIVETDFGLSSAVRTRKANGEYNWRVNQLILPTTMLIPIPGGHKGETSMVLPIDDDHCAVFLIFPVERMPMVPGPDGQLIRLDSVVPVEQSTFQFKDGVIIDIALPIFNKRNGYGLDRQIQQATGGTGLPGGPKTEDQVMVETMGFAVDRSQEHLDATDKPIIALRNRLMRAAADVQNGIEPGHPYVGDLVPYDVDSDMPVFEDMVAERSDHVTQSA
ncbi:Rieske 2Fe-2S domain-containing protein [Mycobacterium sp. Aquia_216]|uniref:Rieske 2Fe-2S domain-containing protein n=1 Tax=Mycobacterium sp. Aquia_216 TaxID=2991729 RepID=UPI00227A3E25|nr:Rieske 2Fe-2S domain-containing protein [Mycobacterium sp. Aquia_216]WAJ44317.1 Rieske 2Fe-2S domain-containing protein [Mycobacterium sp. Aquia_216]